MTDFTAYPSRHMPLGNASVLVHYEMIDGAASLLSMVINGMHVDPEDVLDDHVLVAWCQELEHPSEDDPMTTLFDVVGES